MRTVINISLPKSMAAFVRREAKRRGFSSVSEFIRHLIREYQKRQGINKKSAPHRESR